VGLVQGALENLVMGQDFWSGKRVLVTGHTGFKGGWLALWLERLGAKVIGYSLPPPSQPSLFEQARVGAGIVSIEGDVRDADHLAKVFAEHRPEIVFHLAAQALVLRSYVEPVETYSTNVMGTVNVLEGIRRAAGVLAAVMVTTDKCYHNNEWLWPYREADRLGGADPYSSSKACAELAIAAYRTSFYSDREPTTAIASARAGNVIGGGDWAADRLVPDAVRGFLHGETVQIRHPDAVRPWQHVLEPLHGYMCLAEALVEGDNGLRESWNFGPRDEDVQPVRWIIETFAAHWGEGARWGADTRSHQPEAGRLMLDCAKARHRLGWKPVLDLPTALQWTAEWYRRQAGGTDGRALCEMQVERYQALREN
jgi:CDP-glucose 4,6-dehydratase